MMPVDPDLLRLLVVPAFIWIAVLDIRTRRVPSWIWWPLGTLGVLWLAGSALHHVDLGGVPARLWMVRVTLSLGIVAPLGYLFHRLGAFGAADAKAIVVIALLYPTAPPIAGLDAPLFPGDIGVLSLTTLVNGVLLGLAYPIGLALRNGIDGHLRPAMCVGRPVHWSTLERRHGVLLEDGEGFTRRGLDLDALRMYLRWRGTDLETLRADPQRFARPESVPDAPATAGDGRVRTDGGEPDPWAARAFLADVGSAYGTRPEDLREGLSLVARRERVWISPGIPFLVPIVAGLLVGLTIGDLFALVLAAIAG